MPDILAPQLQYSPTPDRMVMMVDGLGAEEARYMAVDATYTARMSMPRVTGATASRLTPISGRGWFGILFPDSWVWYMEHGTNPFTMVNLAGKTIPMWVDDQDGSARAKNPKARTRTTQDGRFQVLIFRKAARIGQQRVKTRRNPVTGSLERSSVPASYPGAPGRIANRAQGQGWEGSRVAVLRAGQVARGNVGVRWRHPGLRAAQYINSAIAQVAFRSNVLAGETIYVCDAASLEGILQRRAA